MRYLLLLVLFFCSCVSTSFHDEIKPGKNFVPIKKMIVVVDVDNMEKRIYWEKKISQQLRNKNVKSQTSYKVLKSRKDIQKAISIWKKKAFEGIMLIRLDNILNEQYEDFDKNRMAAEWTQFEANNERSMKNYYQRSASKGDDKNIESTTVLVMYSRIFSLRKKSPELIWSAFSDSKNAVNMKELGNSFVAGLLKELKKSKII